MNEHTSWIWGRHPVLEAIRADLARLVLVSSGRKSAPILEEIRRLTAQRAIPLRIVPQNEIAKIAPGSNTQGVAAQIQQRRPVDIDDVLKATRRPDEPAFLLALDQIQDPQNLGALLRTASAAGAHGVIIPERRSAHLSGTVNKVS